MEIAADSKRAGLRCALALMGVALTGPVGAQEQRGVAGFVVQTDTALDTQFVDNFYFSASDAQAAAGVLLRPSATLYRETGKLDMRINLDAEAAAFSPISDKDDYFDSAIRSRVDIRPSQRQRFNLGLDFRLGHDPFGSDRTEGNARADEELDQWQDLTASAGFRFGAPGALLNWAVGGALQARDYRTNEFATRFLNRDISRVDTQLFVNVSPKTAFLLDLIHNRVEFEQEPSGTTRDGDLWRVRLGAQWQATGKTEGDIRIGYLERQFDDNKRNPLRGLDWKLTLAWLVSERSKLELASGRRTQESYVDNAQVIDLRSVDLSWNYIWTSRTRSVIDVRYDDAQFFGAGRRDMILGLGAGLRYQVSRRFALSSHLSFSERDSNSNQRDFERTALTLGARLAI